MEHIEFLSKKCPHRHTGEDDERKAAEYIAKKLRNYRLDVELFETKVMGWEVTDGPEFSFIEPKEMLVECAPFIYSGSTPINGLEGILQHIGTTKIIGAFDWKKYAIADLKTQAHLAYVVGRTDGPAIAQPGPGDDQAITWPSCIIGREDYERIEEWRRVGKTIKVRYFCQTKYKPGVISFRVQANLEGSKEPDKVIVVCAHHDCQGALGFPHAIDCPGAQDNASGCAALLELAKYFAERDVPRTIRFITFGGEEWGLLLSKEYVRFLKDANRLENVIACVNLDEVAKGPYFSATGKERELKPKIHMQRLVQKILKDMELSGSSISSPIASSDHWPFYLEGKPFVYIHPSSYPEYHRGNDVYPNAVDLQAWENSVEAARRIVAELQRVTIE